jgi:hypothetical protein
MTQKVPSHLAAFFAGTAALSVAVLVSWAQHTAARTDDLVTQLCAHGADPYLCAQAGIPATRYVMTSHAPVPVYMRWPQMAEPR